MAGTDPPPQPSAPITGLNDSRFPHHRPFSGCAAPGSSDALPTGRHLDLQQAADLRQERVELRWRASSAAVVVAEAKRAAALGLKPLARLVGYAHAGVEPLYMGIGPVPATRLVLQRTGLSVADLDVIDVQRGFCSPGLRRDTGTGPRSGPRQSQWLGDLPGPSGGSDRGHHHHQGHLRAPPHGARYALVTMCIGGGQSIAAIFERV